MGIQLFDRAALKDFLNVIRLNGYNSVHEISHFTGLWHSEKFYKFYSCFCLFFYSGNLWRILGTVCASRDNVFTVWPQRHNCFKALHTSLRFGPEVTQSVTRKQNRWNTKICIFGSAASIVIPSWQLLAEYPFNAESSLYVKYHVNTWCCVVVLVKALKICTASNQL